MASAILFVFLCDIQAQNPSNCRARQLDLRALMEAGDLMKQRAHAVVLSPVIRFEEYRPCRARRGCLAREIFFCARGACDARAGQRLPLLAYANMTVFSRQGNLVVWCDSDKPVEPSQLGSVLFFTFSQIQHILILAKQKRIFKKALTNPQLRGIIPLF